MTGELILIIEDNDKNRKLVRDVLTFKGYAVIETATGEEGVRLARERCPSLVLHFRGRHIDEPLTSLTPSYCRAGSTAEQKT
jgi:hypothetical protein